MAMQDLLNRLHELRWEASTIEDVKQLVGRHVEPCKWLVLRPRYRDVALVTSHKPSPFGIEARVRIEPGYRRARFEIFDVSDYRSGRMPHEPV